MKGTVWFIAILGVFILSTTIWTEVASGARKGKSKEEEERLKAMEAKRAAKEELNNTEWEISLTRMAKEGARAKTDILRFVNYQVVSEALSSRAYPASNYTLTIKEDGTVVWETMQTHEEEGLAFWRGEWRKDPETQGDMMSGVLSLHPREGEPENFSFVSESKKDIEIVEEAPKAGEIVEPEKIVEPEEVIEEEKPKEPKRRRRPGWFRR